MARRKQCRDMSEKRGQDTLMPVSPNDQPMEEGLSCNGETEEGGGRGMETEEKREGESDHEDEEGESERRRRRGVSIVRKEVTEGPDQKAERRA